MKYTRMCKYCHRTCQSRRSFHRHMLHYHHQLGGGGVSSGLGVKLKVSPITTDTGKGGLSFRTLSYKAPNISRDDEQLLTATINPYSHKQLYTLVCFLELDISVAQMGALNTIRNSIAGPSLITVRQVLKRSSWVNKC